MAKTLKQAAAELQTSIWKELEQGSTNFPKICKSVQNSRYQKCNMKHFPHEEPINIMHQRAKFSSSGNLAHSICAPLTDKNHLITQSRHLMSVLRTEHGTIHYDSGVLYRTRRLSETSRQTGILLLRYTMQTERMTTNFEQGKIRRHERLSV